MAAPSRPTGTVQHRLYIKNHKAADLPAPAANTGWVYNDVVAAGKLIGADVGSKPPDANWLQSAIAPGPAVEAAGNSVSYTKLGAETTSSIAGAAELGEITIPYVPTESETIDESILDAKIGDNIEFAVLKWVGAGRSVYYGQGEVSGVSAGFDTPSEHSITIALKFRPVRLKA